MAETEIDKQTMFLKIQRTSKDPTSNKAFYYVDIDEIPGFLLLLKNHIFTVRIVKILCLSFTCEDIGVAMVTNIITQLQ